MLYKVENEYISCLIDPAGAQLTSLRSRKTGTEYIWNGDPEVWKWHAPVLFPQCGNFPDGYTHNGTAYRLPQHGFLRDVVHEQVSDGVFLFETQGESDYPFPFSATTCFIPEGQSLIHRIEIENKGSGTMPFSLGFHTGFALSNAVLEFGEYEPELGGRVFVAEDTDEVPTRFFTDIMSASIICSDATGKKIMWSSSGYTTLVLWSSPGHFRDFICIEPRIDTVPCGAKEPFGYSLAPGSRLALEERITLLS